MITSQRRITQPNPSIPASKIGMKLPVSHFPQINSLFSSPIVDTRRVCRRRNRLNEDYCKNYRRRLDTAFEALRRVSKISSIIDLSRSLLAEVTVF